ncbi:MAG TPA: ABC transporter permease subunit [Pantanalinema sp.]
MEWQPIWTIAQRELLDALRSRLVWMFAAVFAVLALGLSYFGLVGAGYAEVTGFAKTSASLLNLVLILFPLVALFLGTSSMTSERGALELLLSQPVTRSEVMVGKFLGLALTLVASTLVGFGAAGLVIGVRAGGADAGRFLALTGLAIALEVAFLSVSLLISAVTADRVRALGAAVAVWFGSVILYDLLVVGGAVLIGAKQLSAALVLLLFLNPVDLVRVLGILSLDSATAFGATGASLMRMFGPVGALVALIVALALWMVAPLGLALRLFRRADL